MDSATLTAPHPDVAAAFSALTAAEVSPYLASKVVDLLSPAGCAALAEKLAFDPSALGWLATVWPQTAAAVLRTTSGTAASVQQVLRDHLVEVQR